jgi:hypothetical protein
VLANVSGPSSDVAGFVEKALLALRKTGALTTRARPAVVPALFAPAMARFIAVYNAWDEAAYKAMLSPNRGLVTPQEERDELAGYRSFHGACTGYEPIEVTGARAARLRMRCERGSLEMAVDLDEAGLIRGFFGTVRDVPPPPAVARAAARLAGLVGKWDEAIYKQILGSNTAKSREERMAFFDSLRAAHGSCTVKGYTRTLVRQELTLACERGGELRLELELDSKEEDLVKSYSIKTIEVAGPCPVKK